jgi:hypothetical protein
MSLRFINNEIFSNWTSSRSKSNQHIGLYFGRKKNSLLLSHFSRSNAIRKNLKLYGNFILEKRKLYIEKRRQRYLTRDFGHLKMHDSPSDALVQFEIIIGHIVPMCFLHYSDPIIINEYFPIDILALGMYGSFMFPTVKIGQH